MTEYVNNKEKAIEPQVQLKTLKDLGKCPFRNCGVTMTIDSWEHQLEPKFQEDIRVSYHSELKKEAIKHIQSFQNLLKQEQTELYSMYNHLEALILIKWIRYFFNITDEEIIGSEKK